MQLFETEPLVRMNKDAVYFIHFEMYSCVANYEILRAYHLDCGECRTS